MDEQTLPLLVQTQVLFPGATLPIRLETVRQRKLIRDVVKGDRVLGVVAIPTLHPGDEAVPRTGLVGCVARVVSAKKLPQRRVRIVVEGKERFAVKTVLASEDGYPRAVVTPYTDFDESLALLETFAEEVRQFYTRYVRASRKIADSHVDAGSQLPSDPVELSMVLPAILSLDEESNQRFLSSRSTLMRLRELSALLAPAAATAEAGADVHARSRTNGHGAKRS